MSTVATHPSHSPSGPATPRIDGLAKVTGRARYAADDVPAMLAYAALVQATVALGKIDCIATAEALKTPGVLHVLTHENLPRLKKVSAFPMGASGHSRLPLQDDQIRFAGQAVALVVAETLEVAREAASKITVTYKNVQKASAVLDSVPPERIAKQGLMDKMLSEDSTRGDPDKALAESVLVFDAEYETSRCFHMAMEPHATTASWDAEGNLTVREGSQWVDGAQDVFARWFGLKRGQVRLISHFIGGGFGSKIGVYPHAALAAMAARECGRPVKLVLERDQIAPLVGNRPSTRQHIRLGADSQGHLTTIVHNTLNESGKDVVYNEPGCRSSKSAYAAPNYRSENSVAKLDITPPTWMRAPGDAAGSFAIECAMDELAIQAGLDPLHLRLRNEPESDPDSGKPWSTRHHHEALKAGAKTIGWSARNAEPMTRRDGNEWVGMGMACASFSSLRAPSEAKLILKADGHVILESRGVDIGTGAYTAMAIVVAEALNIPVSQVEVRLGDSLYARSAIAGGSMMTASLGAAVQGAASELLEELIVKLVRVKHSAFHRAERDRISIGPGRLVLDGGEHGSLSYGEALSLVGQDTLEVLHRTHPTFPSRLLGPKAFTTLAGVSGPSSGQAAVHSSGAQFVEVGVDADTDSIRVRRMVGVFDCGRIINPTTARSQLLGGMIMGLGMALSEKGDVDSHYARAVNTSLGEYLVPVHADIPPMEVQFVGEYDAASGPLGSKAVGEIGITGVAAAIANAVYNATGKRLRSLPLDARP